MSKYYYTFGSAEQFPLKNGYIVIQAESISQAHHLFRAMYPDHTDGILNCSDYYTEKSWEKATENHSMHFYGELRAVFNRPLQTEEKIACCFCGSFVSAKNTHDAQPVKDGRCCEQCNYSIVVPERIRMALRGDLNDRSSLLSQGSRFPRNRF